MSGEFFPEWERNGFASQPDKFVASGSEVMLRSYCATIDSMHDFVSAKIGRFFFVPALGATSGPPLRFFIDQDTWTGSFLEQRLNAFVFGNGYERMGVWALNPGVHYEIGFIGFDTRTSVEVGTRAEPGPIPLYRHRGSCDPFYFRQIHVKPRLPDGFDSLPDRARRTAFDTALSRCFRLVDDFAIIMPLTRQIGRA